MQKLEHLSTQIDAKRFEIIPLYDENRAFSNYKVYPRGKDKVID